MHTFREVQRAFPYLVSKEFASGGGDVSIFVFPALPDVDVVLNPRIARFPSSSGTS